MSNACDELVKGVGLFVITVLNTRDKWKYFLSIVVWYPKEHSFRRFLAAAVCPFGKRNMQMNVSVDRGWSGTGREKQSWRLNLIWIIYKDPVRTAH